MWERVRYTLTRSSFVLLFITIVFICGCQSTPENIAVVYGGDLEEKIEKSPLPIGIYNAPESWVEMLDTKGGNTKIEISASVIVPNVTSFPVYKVKQVEFDDTLIMSLVNYFAQGKDVIRYTEPTKAELEKQLILAKKSNNEENEEMVAIFQNMIETAPESVESAIITDWDVEQSTAGCYLGENGGYSGLGVSNSIFSYFSGHIVTESMLVINEKNGVGDVLISEKEAIVAAQKMLQELGIDYMITDSLEKAQLYKRLTSSSIYAEYSEQPVSKGYLIRFARSIDGITGIINNGVSLNIMDDFAYKAPLYPEEIQIYVGEEGEVQSFVWLNPIEIEEKLNENVGLLDFDEVMQRIRKMLTFINSYDDTPTMVTSIEMNMAIVNVKDNPKEAMYIPAWFIHYAKIYDDVQQEYVLVINAIDGGRVLELPVNISPEIQSQMDEDR